MSNLHPRIAVLIPALNEEVSLAHVLSDLPREVVEEVVVIDNGSADRTTEVARAGGATVLSEPRRGYGSACLAGIAYLKARDPDIVVFLDADYSDYPDELPAIVRPIVAEGYDFVIGSRTKGEAEPGALLFQARFGNALATSLIYWLYGFPYSDLGPFRAIRLPALLKLGMTDCTYGWNVEMQIKAVRQGLRIAEVPVRYRKRAGGESKVSGTIKGTLLAGWKILWTVFRYARESA
ncbi:MAG TPA: glycosyltransferase family 2 protein [Candidatus Binatia bacterium]|jgi:glycosyltransferase involved in cell wall biosynthesis|nr:glycosyltransferase family 2 protein [Candidatus Binatia bacterium]